MKWLIRPAPARALKILQRKSRFPDKIFKEITPKQGKAGLISAVKPCYDQIFISRKKILPQAKDFS
ncbi:MAG TPA: hypothetical protein IAB25_06855 [Candidatus Coproplasma stercoravium]|nr:hypothetical protein [Candidatus Coproplasma stercoravium]